MGANHKSVFSAEMQKSIKDKLENVETTISSYVELKSFRDKEFSTDVHYGTLSDFCRRRFGSKLKVSRKSHINKDKKKVAEFKEKGLPEAMNKAKKEYEKGNYDCVDLLFQDESRFALITRRSRVLTARGVKPVGGHQHDYTYRWLWGAFSFLTGCNYSMYTCSTDKLFFINHL